MDVMADIKTTEAEIVVLRQPNAQPEQPVPPPTGDAKDEKSAAAMANKRRRGFRLLALILILGGSSWWGWTSFFAGDSMSTDNAYVAGDVATITPSINGSVAQVNVTETQSVKAGDILVVLDGSDLSESVNAAKASVADAARRANSLVQSDATFAAQISSRHAEARASQAQVSEARAALAKASQDMQRRAQVFKSGAISGEEYAQAKAGRDLAQAALSRALAEAQAANSAVAAAQGTRATNLALIGGRPVWSNAEVVVATSRLQIARNEQARTIIRAPFDGVVARKQVQIGQRVQAGAPLMTIVPMDKLYVMANFKEDQIREMAVGQAVTLTSDRYGSKVTYRGRVSGFAAGTGSAFAAIPAQNATGNWIKVVQRVPVRIALDPAQLKSHPLLVGLSMTAAVDLGK